MGTRQNSQEKRVAEQQEILRQQLVDLIKGGNAHVDYKKAFEDFPAEMRGKKPKGSPHTAWEILEHMRIAQGDILEYSRNADHNSPDFPDGYWPKDPEPPDPKAWDRTLNKFCEDLRAMCSLIKDPASDLYASLPNGSGHTLLREALILADHNSYHLGQLVLLRRMLGSWPEE